ncbi:MAG: iron dependent repressor [Gemmatimonadetes bacterium]|nr:iron dependent repressor [Gemmatimonadota bacterium]
MSAARHPADSLSGPAEDYLKAIYDLEQTRGAGAATNDIAQRLDIAAASVSGMIRRLAEHGLIEHEPYRGVRLTPQGRMAALRTIRRHRVIESYLATALGYPWDRVHDEAELLEHAASDELVDRMAAAIGEPATDPHGAPIPARDGSVTERPVIALEALGAGAVAVVARVGDEDAARLRYLAELGILPGARVEVVNRAPFDGPLTLRVDGDERTIGPALAAHVLVATPERSLLGG